MKIFGYARHFLKIQVTASSPINQFNRVDSARDYVRKIWVSYVCLSQWRRARPIFPIGQIEEKSSEKEKKKRKKEKKGKQNKDERKISMRLKKIPFVWVESGPTDSPWRGQGILVRWAVLEVSRKAKTDPYTNYHKILTM